MVYIMGNDSYDNPDNLISIEKLLNKFKIKLLLPKRILELEVPDDFISYKYFQKFDELPESEKEFYYNGYIDDLEEGVIDSIDDVFESFHRFEGEFQVIEIKEPPTNEDIPDGEDIADFFLNMDNHDLAESSCLFYYEYPCPNQEGIPVILEYLWNGYASPILYN